MLVFLGIAFLIYGGLHLYALGKVWNAFPHSAALALALALWGVVMTVAPLIIWFMGKQGWHDAVTAASWVAYAWMGFLFLFCCVALLLDVARALAWIMEIKWPLGGLAALLGIGVPTLALAGYALIEARQIRVERLHITTPKPVSGCVTIAQISDLHLGPMLGGAFLDRIVEILHEARPDVIVATGDMIDGQGDDLDELSRHFLAVKPPNGAYAIIGNHEYFAGLDTSVRFLRNAGFTVLRGEWVSTDGIILAGVDDPSAGNLAREMSADARRALLAAARNKFVILLKHQPVVTADIPFDLQLSGHAHGGQIFPFGFFTLLAYGVRAGFYRYADGGALYVNRGAGTWGPPMRLFAPPEITLITIESEHQ